MKTNEMRDRVQAIMDCCEEISSFNADKVCQKLYFHGLISDPERKECLRLWAEVDEICGV